MTPRSGKAPARELVRAPQRGGGSVEAGSSYREAMPVAALRPWIRSYYLLEDPAPGGAGTGVPEGLMVPDGHLELSLNLGGARLDRTGGAWRERPRACVDEVFDATRRIRWHGPIRYVAVKFRFEAGLELLDVEPSDVAMGPLELDLLPPSGLRALEDGVGSASTWDGIVAALVCSALHPLVRSRRTKLRVDDDRMAVAVLQCEHPLVAEVVGRPVGAG